MMMEGVRGRGSFVNGGNPFTPSQWQELEDQALIFKCLQFGWPIPSHLLLPIRRSCCFSSPSQSPMGLFPPHYSWGWGSFQLGLKGRAEDPEPGRCRRTDGKKWRCSKKACPDSKYCERHLHRGKNRPRRPLESSPQRSKNPSVPPSHLSLVPPSIKELRQVLVSSPPSLAVKRLMNEASRCCHGHVEEGIEDTSSFNINKIKESTHGEIEEEKDKRVALEEQGPTEEDGFASASRSPMAWPLLLDLNV